jgi:hypothetical protein
MAIFEQALNRSNPSQLSIIELDRLKKYPQLNDKVRLGLCSINVLHQSCKKMLISGHVCRK